MCLGQFLALLQFDVLIMGPRRAMIEQDAELAPSAGGTSFARLYLKEHVPRAERRERIG